MRQTTDAPHAGAGETAPEFAAINEAKGDFNAIYNRPDPRSYFTTLGALDYRIPDEARPVFARVLDHLKENGPARPRVLDVGCSYGVNAASLKFGLDFGDLAARYAAADEMPSEALAKLDHHALAAQPVLQDALFVGLDAAPRAVGYARRVGLLDDGIVADLESQTLGAGGTDALGPVDLVISTGCIGYIGERTLGQIVDAVEGEGPWVASFVLRMFPFEPVAEALAARGLVTEKLPDRTFRQRRFADEAERRKIFAHLEAQGLDPAGVETDGYLHAEFFLSRPGSAIAAAPLASIMA